MIFMLYGDNIKRKVKKHYGSNFRSFSVVMLSNLDPRAIKFVESQAKKKDDKWDSIFEDTGNDSITPTAKKKKRIRRKRIFRGKKF